jgi:tRNA/rRNA methyltransferase
MSNMGFDRLILIAPQCELTFAAQQAAATGQEGLQNRTVYKSWTEFFTHEPDGIRISLTARDGRGRAVQDLKSTLQWMLAEAPLFQDPEVKSVPVYLIFGPEDWGLSAEDLEFTHFCCSIPTFGENSSLNLAQAALLALFILRETWGGTRTPLDGEERVRIGPSQLVFPEETLKTWLIEMGYDLSKPKINVYTTLKRMLLHNVPTQKEMVALETVLQQSLRKLREYNEWRHSKKEASQKGKNPV